MRVTKFLPAVSLFDVLHVLSLINCPEFIIDKFIFTLMDSPLSTNLILKLIHISRIKSTWTGGIYFKK